MSEGLVINMKSRSLFVKMFGFFCLVIIFMALFISALIGRNIKENNIDIFAKDLIVNAKMLSPQISRLFNAGDFKGLDAFIKESAAYTDRRITIIDKSGTVLADSAADALAMDNHLNRKEVLEAFSEGSFSFSPFSFPSPIYAPQTINRAVGDGLARPATDCEAPFLYWSAERQRSSEGPFSSLPLSLIESQRKPNTDNKPSPAATSIRKSPTLNIETLYAAIPIYDNLGNKTAVIRISVPIENISILSYQFISKNYPAFLFILAAALFISFLISKSVGSKIAVLKNAFKELSLGNFGKRLQINSKDELEQLSDTFNEMSVNLEKLFKRIDADRDELEKIIAAVSDAIVAIDDRGIILFANEAFKKLFNAEISKGMFYWQVLDDNIFKPFILKRSQAAFSYEHRGKFFSCIAAPIEENAALAIVFHDITGIKDLENFKKDLISNVSHELKTPLASVKLYLELLEDEQMNSQSRAYLEVMEKNAARLSDIVDDLLILSEVENNGSLDIAEFYVCEVFEEMKVLFEKKAADKKLDLIFDCDKGLKMKADKFRIIQALSNLIDNAVRYSEKGWVKASAFLESGEIVMSVSDTGIGIEPQHLEKIFERFYVVDKSRSRKTGGTGLGLSIVNHIARLHGATVKASSFAPEGSTFTLRFPH